MLITLTSCNGLFNAAPHVSLQLIAEDFTSPTTLVSPNDGAQRLFVVDQTGLISIIANGRKQEESFLDLRDRIVKLADVYDERGLLGLAFHPDFKDNGRFFVYYSAPLRPGLSSDAWDHTSYISEFTVARENPNRADPASERVILAIDKPGYNLEAGNIAFGPDGFLYIATGDSVRNPATAAGQFAQDTSSLLGKILRIDVDTPGKDNLNYSIPSDNPFANGGGRPEIFAYGFRNPYRFSFDDSTPPRLFVADVGQAQMEEVDLVSAGGNYGWPVREGTTCFNAQSWSKPLERCATKGLIDPIIAYPHDEVLSAIIGGMVYRGAALSGLNGSYIFGDWGRGHGRLFVATPPRFGKDTWMVTEIQIDLSDGTSTLGQLLGIGEDSKGELYLLVKAPGIGPVQETGKIYKIVSP